MTRPIDIRKLPARDAVEGDNRVSVDAAGNILNTRQLGKPLTEAEMKALPVRPTVASDKRLTLDDSDNFVMTNQPTDFFSSNFKGLSDAVAAVTANPDSFDRVKTDSYRTEAECTALGIDYPDGGGAEYTIVPAGTGTDDGGSFIDAASVQLQLNSIDVNAEVYGSVPLDTFNNTPSFNAIEAAGRSVIIQSGKTYGVIGWTISTGATIQGKGKGKAVVRLMNGGNTNVIEGTDVSDVNISNVTFDGNKTNQGLGAGNNWRGVYIVGVCSRLLISDVKVIDTVDHGFNISEGGNPTHTSGVDSYFNNIEVTGSGSEAHLAAGGDGGSGMAGGARSSLWSNCVGSDNYLNGMKTSGTMSNCQSRNNGGGFETGFAQPEFELNKYISCVAENNNGDGFRNLGQNDRLQYIACDAIGNGTAGMSFINGVAGVVVIGGNIKNNGQLGKPVTDTEGNSGIFISGTLLEVESASIIGVTFDDDQVVKTQEYGIHINKDCQLTISETCQFRDSLLGDTRVSPLASSANVNYNGTGLPFLVNNTVLEAVTGTTASVNTESIVIPARSVPDSFIMSFMVRGNVVGAAGSKIVRIVAGSSSAIVINTVGDGLEWYISGTLTHIGSSVLVSYEHFTEGGAVTSGALLTAESKNNDLDFKINVQLGDALDTINQTVFKTSSI